MKWFEKEKLVKEIKDFSYQHARREMYITNWDEVELYKFGSEYDRGIREILDRYESFN